VIKILTKKFGFEVSRQKGSNIVFRRFQGGRKIVTVVPNHKEIAIGTLRGILKLAQISPKEFLEKYHNKN